MFLAVGSFTCLLVALVNYELLDIKVFVNRALVYVALTAFVIAAYGLIVGYLGTAFHSENILFSLIATGLIAILFQPLRERLQRAVNRLMYGERSEPYRLLNRLAQRLEFAFDRNAALPLATETIAQALKLPYVAIRLKQDGSDRLIAVYGSAQDRSYCFPLTYAGETIGELVAATRTGEDTFTPADLRILSDLTRQIGPIAHAALVSADLEQARLRIVEAREEARRRLGSDLHDGVGHQITALARQAEQASNLLKQDPNAAQELLSAIRAQLNLTSSGVRQLAHQLYPPELELLVWWEPCRNASTPYLAQA